MKWKNLSDNHFILFLLKENYSIETILSFLKKHQKDLSLNGFYKGIYCSNPLGTFLQMQKIQDSLYRSTVDFQLSEKDFPIFFRADDYEVLSFSKEIRYKDGDYYTLVDHSFDEILKRLDFGNLVFGLEMEEKYQQSYPIK